MTLDTKPVRSLLGCAVVLATIFSPDAFGKDKRVEESSAKTVTVPAGWLDLLVESQMTWSDMLTEMAIPSEDQRLVVAARQKAEKAARTEQARAISPGNDKVRMKVGQTIMVNGLNEKAIDSCVQVFDRDLTMKLPAQNRRLLHILAQKHLMKRFSSSYSLTLHKQLPEGVPGPHIGTSDALSGPPQLRGYYLMIQQFDVDGHPEGNPGMTFPNSLSEGKPYDFVTIDTDEDDGKSKSDTKSPPTP